MQSVLSTEFGGMSEVLAELSARTGEPRWLALARRFHHHAVLDPLVAGRDELAYLHANTQIPKVIGLARRAELESDASLRSGARYFWQAVTGRRSYVIGGNSDREYFQEPDSISRYITEQTCESCNTYNMLKLTRRLFAAEPRAAYFDYYERAHLNHILAQHRPADGMFAYMVPLMSGAAREWSEPFDSFWCCVGTGMESHAKHGDSVFWQDSERCTSTFSYRRSLDWSERGARVALDTAYPFDERVALRIEAIQGREPFAIAMRLPAWCEAPSARLTARTFRRRGYRTATCGFRRRWKTGDTLSSSCRRVCVWSRRQTIPQLSRCCADRSCSLRTSARPARSSTAPSPHGRGRPARDDRTRGPVCCPVRQPWLGPTRRSRVCPVLQPL
jgi:DUF1680 family protein